MSTKIACVSSMLCIIPTPLVGGFNSLDRGGGDRRHINESKRGEGDPPFKGGDRAKTHDVCVFSRVM